MRTRIGMLIRAGASNREMVGALGVNISSSIPSCSGSVPALPDLPE